MDGGGGGGGLTLKSGAFADGGVIPRQYGYKNGNKSPPLDVGGIPGGTASLALIMDDPDAVGAVGKVWVHWVLWNVAPEGAGAEVPEGAVPEGCREGRTDFGENGYGGPAPPDREHTYVFRLYALDRRLDCGTGSTREEVEDAMRGHVLAEARLEGRYSP